MADLQRKTANIITGKIDNSVIYSNGVVSATNEYTTFYAPVTAGSEYSFAYTSSDVDSAYVYGFFTALPAMGSTTYNNSRTVKNYAQNPTITVTVPDTCTYIGIRIPNTALAQGKDVMLNAGSSVLPFEPHTSTGWLHSLRKLTTATEAVENPLYSDGTAITSYTIKGNTVQNGTPTPTTPVDVNGVGVRTENYFNINDNRVSYQQCTISINNDVLTQTNTGGYARSEWVINNLIVGESYTFAIHFDNPNGCNVQIRLYDSNNSGRLFDTSVFTDSRTVEFTFTAQTTTHYIRIYSNTLPEASQYSVDFSNIMLNVGSTTKPYEPYGYKIPISNGQQTTNIYLGSTQTVRQVRKLVLTGQENWLAQDTIYYMNSVSDNYYVEENATTYISTHFIAAFQRRNVSLDNLANGYFCFGSSSVRLRFRLDSCSTTAEFKQYLAQQYANGTPVTVWYVLETPQAASVNEPLQKIGDYADTLSNAASIPTTEGANSITVDTTVQPSEFSATWTGWHNSSVKEWDGSDWS